MRQITAKEKSDARKKFSGYKKEQQKLVRKAEVVDSRLMERFRRVWDRYQWSNPQVGTDGALREVRRAMKAVGNERFSAEEIMLLSTMISEFSNIGTSGSKEGIILSAMINSGSEASFKLSLEGMKFVDDLLVRNLKNVDVEAGRIGCIGNQMKNGRVTVKANQIHDIAMESGEMRVMCPSVENIIDLRGGTIAVEGDVNAIAQCNGGSIHVSGEINNIVLPVRVAIFRNGKLVRHGQRGIEWL